MILGIDASNIRRGGGITHLSEILRCARPFDYGFSEILVWAGSHTLSHLCDQAWLKKVCVPKLDGSLTQRIYWQQFVLSKLLRQNNCDLLFSPGGSLPSITSMPTVTMSRNLLPFEISEMGRYRLSPLYFRYLLLRISQSRNFRKSEGMIFLTEYARSIVMRQVGLLNGTCTIIHHGIDKRFYLRPRKQKTVNVFSAKRPIRFLYVSIVNFYKHQWHVVEATGELRKKGVPAVLDLVGPAYSPALRRLNKVMQMVDPSESFVHYKGSVPYADLGNYYHQADIFIFASSCENMPNILLEAMAAGLPIACSNRGPMPEILGDAGVYFDPEQPDEIAQALYSLVNNASLRERCAWSAYEKAQQYSWGKCARETFSFLSSVGKKS